MADLDPSVQAVVDQLLSPQSLVCLLARVGSCLSTAGCFSWKYHACQPASTPPQEAETEFFAALKVRGEGPGLCVRRIGGELGKGLFAERCDGCCGCATACP